VARPGDWSLKDDERRKSVRRPSRTRVWADPGGVAPVLDCVIVDLSDEGASIAAGNGAELPETFRLQLDSATSLGEAEVVWRRDNLVGVKLDRSKSTKSNAVKPNAPKSNVEKSGLSASNVADPKTTS